jgi:hypothetical protein
MLYLGNDRYVHHLLDGTKIILSEQDIEDIALGSTTVKDLNAEINALNNKITGLKLQIQDLQDAIKIYEEESSEDLSTQYLLNNGGSTDE